MDEQYLTILEFAKRVGVSKQAIYQQLNKKLKPYLIVVDGAKKLDIKALDEVYGQSSVKDNSKEDEQELNKLLIDSLNRQLKEKDRQISELHRLLATSQMQLTESQHRVQQLEDKQALNQEVEQSKDQERKSWWKRLFE